MNHKHRPCTAHPIRVLAILLALCLLFCTATPGYCIAESKIQTAPRKVIAAIPPDSPPTYFKDVNGKPVGFAVDVMNELAQRAGLKVEYVFGQAWEELIQMVLTGKADLIPGLTIDERRQELLAFTDTIEFLPVNLIVASENHTIQGISPGLTIGVIKESAAEHLLKKDQTIRLAIYTNRQTMLFELLAGRVDGIVSLTPNIIKLAADAGVDDKIKVVGKPIIEAKRSLALRKGDMELLTRINKAIGEFIGSPEYQKIYTRWHGKPKPYWTVGRIAAVSGVFLFLAVFGMAVWRYRSMASMNRRLKQSIAEREQAEEALRESEKKYRNVFENHAAVKLLIDPATGSIIETNEAAVNYYGWSHERLRQMKIQEINTLSPEDVRKEMGNALAEKQGHFEFQHRRADGSIRDVEVFSSKAGS
jgi:PAS domain S-box-containing protein